MSSPFSLNGSSDKGLTYAIGGMRAGTFRCGYLSAKLFVYADGIERQISGLSISERRGSGASTCRFVARGGWEPSGGEQLVILQGTRNRIGRLFAGTIIAPDVTTTVDADNRQVSVSAVDWTFGLNGDLVIGRFTGTYDEIALELMERYAPSGFTTTAVQRGLPTVPNGIEFTNVYLSVALARLAKRGGIRQFIDYNADLYFRTDGTRMSHPKLVTRDNVTLKTVQARRDYGQLVTRLYVVARGSQALADVAPGESIAPVNDASIFPDSGLLQSGTQRFVFAGRRLGGGGSLVGPGAAPSSAPTVVLAAGSGVETGDHDYAYVFVTASGKTLPSPIATTSVGLVSAPSSAPTAGTPTTGGSMNAGSHRYYPVFRTASGSTTAGPVSNSVTATGQTSAPSAPSTQTSGGSGLTLSASYRYKQTYRHTSNGTETNPSSAATEFISHPDFKRIAIQKKNPPSGFTQVIYRTAANDVDGEYREIETPIDGGTHWIDASESRKSTVAPTSNTTTANGTCAITNIPVSADAVVTHVDMYREFNSAGAATAKLALSVTNGTTSAVDTLANASLGATVPGSNTAAANRVDVTYPAGPAAVTDIELYRTPIGSAQLKKFHNVGSNTGGTTTDSTPDASLGDNAPTEDNSGLSQPEGQVAAGSTSIIVASAVDFVDTGGWAVGGNGRIAVRYTGKTASSLTGIPPTGPGSLESPIAYNSQISPAPELTGVTSGSPDLGSITYTIPRGQEINVVAQIDNLDAQAVFRGIVPGHSGIKAVVQENRMLSYEEALARGQAYLNVRSQTPPTVNLRSKDINFTVGATAEFDLQTPMIVQEELPVQSVTITNFHPTPPVDPSVERPADYQPDRIVEASIEQTSVEDLLRQDART